MATVSEQFIGNSCEGPSHVESVEAVVDGEKLVSGARELTDSWRRSATEYGIAVNAKTKPNILTETEIRADRERLWDVIAHSQEEIDRLYSIVRQEGAVVLLCNRDGIAIHHRGDEAKKEDLKYWGIWLGGVWSEQIEGTNGIGTCIAEKRPVSVHRGEHFRTRHTQLSCAGAPIFDAGGQLAAVLDTSSITSPTSDHAPALTLAATVTAARAIEERLFRDSFPRAWIVATMPFDQSGPAVLLAVDHDQRVVGADRTARLAFPLRESNLAAGVPLSSLFKYDRGLFRPNQHEDVAARWMRNAGGGLWQVLITPPRSFSSGWIGRADAAFHSLPRISRLGNLPVLEPSVPREGGLPPAMAHRIREYIDSRLAEKVNLEELAGIAGLSVHHFARAFRQSMGIPPHHYILQRRLEQAERLLRDTELPLSEIALQVGFSDQSHLARHFRRVTGISPGAARWKQR